MLRTAAPASLRKQMKLAAAQQVEQVQQQGLRQVKLAVRRQWPRQVKLAAQVELFLLLPL